MTLTMNKDNSNSTVKALRNSAKTFPKLTKPLNDRTNIVVVSLLSNLDRSHANCNANSIYIAIAIVYTLSRNLFPD